MAVPALEAAWNARRGIAVAAVFTSAGVREEFAFPGARLVGRRAIARHVESYIDAVPDCLFEVRAVAELPRGLTTLEWTLWGTHVRDLPGAPARGETLSLNGVSVCEMEGELIREERVYWDAATLLHAAGVLRQVRGLTARSEGAGA
jgi:steroid delta-isomerase-like uncharacterized protein